MRTRLRGVVGVGLLVVLLLSLTGCGSSSTSAAIDAEQPGQGTVVVDSAPSVAPNATPPVSGSNYAWTELAPNGKALVRVVSDGSCPAATVDGRLVAMTPFAQATPGFPYVTCQIEVEAGVNSITVGSRTLPPPPHKLDRIAVVGDIGCYLKSTKQQDCLDPATFPAKQVSDMVAAEKPDLVVFVGDIYYSEDECPPDKAAECGGVPTGDSWPTWAYDFFAPYQSSLSAAPWIFARGNHESCATKDDNGGAGWYQLLAVTASSCVNFNDPYRIDVLDQSFVVFDSAIADDNPVDAAQVDSYAANFRMVHDLVRGHPNTWFVDHRPLWATSGPKSTDTLNLTLDAAILAAGNTLSADVSLILSGHVHALGLFTTTDGRPAQIVSGGGGTELAHSQGSWPGTAIDGTTFSVAELEDSFGYVQFDRAAIGGSSWDIGYRTLGGGIWKSCALSGRILGCS
jgi:hypothetical protein